MLLTAALMFSAITTDGISQEAQQPTTVKVEAPRRVTIVSEKTYNGHLNHVQKLRFFANISGKIVN